MPPARQSSTPLTPVQRATPAIAYSSLTPIQASRVQSETGPNASSVQLEEVGMRVDSAQDTVAVDNCRTEEQNETEREDAHDSSEEEDPDSSGDEDAEEELFESTRGAEEDQSLQDETPVEVDREEWLIELFDLGNDDVTVTGQGKAK